MLDLIIRFSPLVLVLVGAAAVMLADAFSDKGQSNDLSTVTFWAFVGASGGAIGLWVQGDTMALHPLVAPFLAADPMALLLDAVIAGAGAITALLAGAYLREHQMERGEYYVVMLLAAFGAMVLVHSTHLLSVFVGLETMSLGVYSLAAFRRTSPRSVEGAMKYFLLGSFAAALLLFGMALLYGATGEMELAAIATALVEGSAHNTLALLGTALITAGLAFKVGAVPFHMWSPDVYEGAATSVTAFMAVVVKVAAFTVWVRIAVVALSAANLADPFSGWPPLVMGLAVASMLVGNLSALVQTNVKRMLAYSSIAHAGYIMVGFVAYAHSAAGGDEGAGDQALSAMLLYLASYAASSLLVFGSLIWAGSKGKEVVSYEDLKGLGRRHPWIGVAMMVGALSLMGFPPTAGFIGKYYLFQSAVNVGDGLIPLVIFAVLASAVGAFYYLKLIVVMYMEDQEQEAAQAVPMRSVHLWAAIGLAAYFVFRIGIAPGNYMEIAIGAARAL